MPKYDARGFIVELSPSEIIVVGTNRQGAHLAGAAWLARCQFGLEPGFAEGLCGQTYAFPTMDGLDALRYCIPRFYRCADEHPRSSFYMTALGCGIAGHTAAQVAPLFADRPPNVILPPEFVAVLTDTDTENLGCGK